MAFVGPAAVKSWIHCLGCTVTLSDLYTDLMESTTMPELRVASTFAGRAAPATETMLT